MKQLPEHKSPSEQALDLPTLVTILCHLMTCYALRPCEPLATNINRHMKVLLNSPNALEALGEWCSTFQQLHLQWVAIADRHTLQFQQQAMAEAKKNEAH